MATREEVQKLKRSKTQRIIILSLIIFVSIGAFLGIITGEGETTGTKIFVSGVPLIFIVAGVYDLINSIKFKIPPIDDES